MFINDTAKAMMFYMIIVENIGGLTIFNKKQQ